LFICLVANLKMISYFFVLNVLFVTLNFDKPLPMPNVSSQLIQSLILLLDDPDERIHMNVSEKLVSLGDEVISYLESYLETTIEESTISKVNLILSRLYVKRYEETWTSWVNDPHNNLGDLLLLMSNIFGMSEKENNEIQNYIQVLRKKIWLECNQFLTPLEQINVFINVLFKQQHIKDFKLLFKPEHSKFYLINEVVKRQLGSELIIAILYQMYFELFDIPVHIVEVYPGKYYCAYISDMAQNNQKILCFLHASLGEVYSYQDVSKSLGLIHKNINDIKLLSHADIAWCVLKHLETLFDKEGDHFNKAKVIDLIELGFGSQS
jgi:hypothetical protein